MMPTQRERLMLVVLAAIAAALALGGSAQAEVAIFEAAPAEAVERGKLALDKWSAQAASERGLVNVLLGNHCFTTAITALNKECSKLSNEQRCWLAIQFTMCFQRASGFKVMECPTVCPKWSSLQSCVEGCTSKMDDRQQSMYTSFYGDVLNMCLFLQTQNFQQVTAALVTDMHASSTAANASLGFIRRDLQAQSQSLAQSLTALSKLQAMQYEVEAAVQAGLLEVKSVGVISTGLQQSMDKSLNMTSALSGRQEQLLQGFSELETAHAQHAAKAKEAFDQLAQEAAALEQRQARYESLQTRLLSASESLLDQSQGMADLLRVLMRYQDQGNTILSQLQGGSVSVHDVLFYTAALSIPLVFITYPSDVRLLLLGGVLACWGIERAVLQHYVMLFGMLRNGQASIRGSSYLGVQDVKVAVRLLALGGTLGVVVWLLLKRRAVHARREAIFQAIQDSLAAAHYQQAAAVPPGPPQAAIPGAIVPYSFAHQLAPHTPQPPQPPQPPAAAQPAGRGSACNTNKKSAAGASAQDTAVAAAVAAQQQLVSGLLRQQAAHHAGGGQQQQHPSSPAAPIANRGWLPQLFGGASVPQPLAIHPDLQPDLRSLIGQAAAGPSSVPGSSQGPYPLHHQHHLQHHQYQQQQYQQQQHLAWHQQPGVPLAAGPPLAGHAAPANPSSQHQSEGPSSRVIEGTAASEGVGESAGRPAGHSRAAAAKVRGGKKGVTGKAPAVAPAKKAEKRRRAGAAAADEEGDVEASEVTEEHAQTAAGAPRKGRGAKHAK